MQLDDDDFDESTSSWPRIHRRSSMSVISAAARRKKEEVIVPGGLCTIKRVHLADPACDIGVSVWLGRGPQRGLRAPQRPPSGIGPALLVEVHHDPRLVY